MNDIVKYNITVDHTDGVCNVIFGAMTPYFTNDQLVYYEYDAKKNQYTQHIVDMKDVIAFSMLKVDVD